MTTHPWHIRLPLLGMPAFSKHFFLKNLKQFSPVITCISVYNTLCAYMYNIILVLVCVRAFWYMLIFNRVSKCMLGCLDTSSEPSLACINLLYIVNWIVEFLLFSGGPCDPG